MARCELIELKDLAPSDRIDLAPSGGSTGSQRHPEPLSRTRGARLVGDSVCFEHLCWVSFRRGEGHDFQTNSHTHLAWCDLCGEFIWGVYKQSLSCVNCRYTCHSRCRPLIQLDCEGVVGVVGVVGFSRTLSEDVETDVDAVVEDSRLHHLSITQLHQKIKEYNAQINTNLYMSLSADGSYTGFIKVHFQLVRPVSLLSPQRASPPPPSSSPPWPRPDPRTSFYLPRETTKQLHVSSRTRVREVIEALLGKFSVADNPAKFSLYGRGQRSERVCVRKLRDDERPLLLRLCAGPGEESLSFLLRENQGGDVDWDAFSLPELNNFLRILQREEDEHVRQIVRRHTQAREKLEEALRSLGTPG